MGKEALATKYRPKRFSEVVEQDVTKAILTKQLTDKSFKNCLLFTGGAGTGKTTSARIFANEVNDFKGSPIELDAASNNSVDDIRKIIEDSKYQSLDSEYKTYIIDECVTGDTEILTDEGFKRFDSLTHNELIAEYADDGRIDFVKPTEYIEKQYDGDMYRVFLNGSDSNYSILMSPHHVQPYIDKANCEITESYIKDIEFSQSTKIISSGRGTGCSAGLTEYETLAVLLQNDMHISYEYNEARDVTTYKAVNDKTSSMSNLIHFLDCMEIPVEYVESSDNGIEKSYIIFQLKGPRRLLKDYFSVNMGYGRARQFIDILYSSKPSRFFEQDIYNGLNTYKIYNKDNADFIAAILTQAGYTNATETKLDENNHKYYILEWYESLIAKYCVPKKTKEHYTGKIYCVKVPTHKIILRSNGITFISGNCHALSNSAWQAFLKVLEEPPKKSLFVLCTTDPQKIPNTILSRVQRYNFQKITHEGIVSRLKFIIDNENNDNEGITYEDEALDFIAKLSDGGMRDSITLLDKAIGFNKNLTLNNVLESLGSVNYDTMFELTNYLVDMDKKGVIETIEYIHRSGLDLKQFIKQYSYFVLDLCKYDILKSFTYLQIPSVYEHRIKEYDENSFAFFNQLLSEIISLTNNIKWETMPKPLIESTLLLLCSEA